MKRIFVFAATAAVALSSCSKNEVSEVATPNDNPNAIGLTTAAFTTKGAPLDEAALITSNDVAVFIDSETKGDITPSFTYASGAWGQTTNTWSEVDYPANVYSLQDNDGPVGTLASAVSGTTDAQEIFVSAADVTTHKDVIYFGGQLASQPTSNNISAVYKHALSRAYISAKYTDCKVYIASARLVNMDSQGKIAIKNNNTITWSEAGGTSANGLGDYDYYEHSGTVGLYAQTDPSTPLSPAATHDMYVIPQTTVDVADANDINLSDDTYIEFIYRVETDGGESMIGYENLDELKLTDPDATITGGDLGAGGIYVKAYVAVDAKELAAGSYYNLFVDLSAVTVRHANDKFVDKDGNNVEITSKAVNDPVVDEPVNPDPTSNIGLTVIKIDAWPTITPNNL